VGNRVAVGDRVFSQKAGMVWATERSRRGYPAKFVPRPTENGADAVGGNPRDLTDFLVTFPLQVVKPDNRRFLSVQHLKEALRFLPISDPIFFRPGHRRGDFRRCGWFWAVGRLVSSRHLALLKGADDHSAGHHTKVTSQAAPTVKPAQNSEIVLEKGEEDF